MIATARSWAGKSRTRKWGCATGGLLESHGFVHYETSNFARPGFACLHNSLIWRGEDYLGIGLSACSHLAGTRRGNTEDPDRYRCFASEPEKILAFSETLPPEEKARECAVFWLRLFEGVDAREFSARTGFDFFALYSDVLPGLIADGIVAADAERVRVDRRFQPVLDSVLEYFI